MKTTPFTDTHIALGAKMAEFAGFNMPIEYQGINKEHMIVREGVGVFDVSHMGEFWVKGERALDFLQYITSNDVSKQNAENVSLSSYRFGNAGAEPAIIGAALAQELNTVSAPIAGNMGVFMLKPTSKTTAEGEFNAETEKQQLTARSAYSLPYQAINMLQEEANVVDNRANFQ